MAVLEHEVHEKVRIAEDKPYGCHNGSRDSAGYIAPDRVYRSCGVLYDDVRRPIRTVMSRTCRYDMSLTDARCTGCKHRGSGEEYDSMVRSKGS